MVSSGTRPRSRQRPARLARRTGILLTIALTLAACSVSAKIGTPPSTERLASLTPGTSTAQDIRVLLGEPRGGGRAQSSTLREPREIWLYEYTEMEGSRTARTLLLVFLLHQSYDGHLWFSSAQVVRGERED